MTGPIPTTCERISDAEGLRKERPRHRAQRHPGRRLAGRGPLEDRPGVGEAVLLHPGEVGVTGPGTRQRSVAGPPLKLGRVDGVGRHDLTPLRPLRVVDDDRNGPAERHAVPDTAEDLHLVLLELHPRPAPVPGAPAHQLVGDVGRRYRAPRPAGLRWWPRARGRATHPLSATATRVQSPMPGRPASVLHRGRAPAGHHRRARRVRARPEARARCQNVRFWCRPRANGWSR